MAVVRVPKFNQRISAAENRSFLVGAGIQYEQWDLVPGLESGATADAILAAYDHRIAPMKRQGGYTKIDVLDVCASTTGLDDKMRPFSCEHWHAEDEVRFTLEGGGVFCVHPSDAPVFTVEVEAGDMISIPSGMLHWFELCTHRRLLAIRFFQDPAGWEPHYTESRLERQYQAVCFGLSTFPSRIKSLE